jgi:hypothetical protein
VLGHFLVQRGLDDIVGEQMLAAVVEEVGRLVPVEFAGAAGADHVTLLQPIGTEFARGIDQLARVAPELTDLG